jgi:hypothetical protein
MAKGFTEHKDMHSLFILNYFPWYMEKTKKLCGAFQKMDWDNKRKRYAL